MQLLLKSPIVPLHLLNVPKQIRIELDFRSHVFIALIICKFRQILLFCTGFSSVLFPLSVFSCVIVITGACTFIKTMVLVFGLEVVCAVAFTHRMCPLF